MSASVPASPPKIVIVGRPNVGKSTLFNRLLGRRRALVHDLPGVTRDRLEERAQWWVRGMRLEIALVDTGGVGGDKFGEEVDYQVSLAVQEADVVLVLFDGTAGFTPADQEVVRRLMQAGLLGEGRITLAVVNKLDADVHESLIGDFYGAGIDPVLGISAEHARGIDDLQECIYDLLKERLGEWGSRPLSDEEQDEEADGDAGGEAGEKRESRQEGPPQIAIVGRPNAGKSTLVNALLGEERMITSPVAGTTVDAVDSKVKIDGREFLLIDTAGIRRKSKTEQGVEVLSVVQARKALERCDVAILVIDGEQGVTDQDEKIGGLIEEVGCSVVLLVNKWDLLAGKQGLAKGKAAELVRDKMAYLRYAPLMFVSALRRRGLEGLGELLEEVLAQKRIKVGTKEFTEWVRKESEIHNPRNAKFYLCHQSGRYPPTFVCHVSDPEKVHFSLKRHLVNALRERWGYMGSPIRMVFVKGKNRQRS